MFSLIKLGAVTKAQRALKILRMHGIKATLSRLEKPSAEDGCGYAVKLLSSDLEQGVALLEENGIRLIGTVNT